MHKKIAGKLQTGSTFPKQYWLAVNGKPKTSNRKYLSKTILACRERQAKKGVAVFVYIKRQ